MAQMGDYVFEGRGLTDRKRYDRVKALFNALDMDGTLGAWRARVGLRDGERPLTGFEVQLGAAGVFRFDVYRGVMRHGTAYLLVHGTQLAAAVGLRAADTRCPDPSARSAPCTT